MAPTRELVHQIYDVLNKLVRAFIWIVPGIVTGGEKRKSEKARLRKVRLINDCETRLKKGEKEEYSERRGGGRWLAHARAHGD